MRLKFKPYPKPGARSTEIKITPKPKETPARYRYKPSPGYIQRIFTLSYSSLRILQKFIQERELGVTNYDEALQLILQEWKQMKDRQHHPVLIAVPVDMLPRQDESKEEG